MAAFNAATVVEALDWDFRPYVKAHGTVDEPTDAQINAFLDATKALMGSITGRLPEDIDTGNPVAVLAAVDDLDVAVVNDFHQQLAMTFSALCSGTPTPEMLLGLPMRIRNIFYGWLRQEVMSPEAVPGGGNAQVKTLRSAAAG